MLSIKELLARREFVSVATSDLSGQPNAAPKMILDVDDKFIYLVDYSNGRTCENLKINPRISLSFSDPEELKGYKVNGTVKVIAKDAISKVLMRRLEARKIALSTERIIRGVRSQKKHQHFELGIPFEFVVYKIKFQELTEIGPQGEISRRKPGEAQ